MRTLGLADPAFIGGMGGGVQLWTPAAITTALWLDAADASTITTVSGAVSQWSDKSGNNRHVSQTIESRRPIYDATGFNGLPAIDFDGTNDFLKNASYQPAGAVTCFLVFNRDAVSGALLNAQRTNGIFEINGGFSGSYKNLTFTATGTVDPSLGFDIAGGGINQNIILGLQYDGSGSGAADFEAWLNGASQAVVNSGALGFFGETGFSIGARPVQGLSYYNGRISEIIFFQSETSTLERQKIEGYLAHKWGLTASLPSDHPFKTAAPTV